MMKTSNIIRSALLIAAILPVGATHAADATVGKELATKKYACASCHGDDFKTSTPIDAGNPKLAGQHADYLVHAMTAYKTSGNPNMGRSHAVMSAQMEPLTLKEMQDIAAYLSTLPSDLVTRK